MGSEAEAKVLESIPLKRVGRSTHVAALVEHMMREENDYLTGQVITMDGGRTITSSSA